MSSASVNGDVLYAAYLLGYLVIPANRAHSAKFNSDISLSKYLAAAAFTPLVPCPKDIVFK